ncbi:MAG: cytochrome b [Gammaproteobacteria bacterium]|jgi:cytochrome b561
MIFRSKTGSGNLEPAGAPASRYGSVTILLHWLTLFLIAAIYALIEAHEMIPRGNALRGATEDWHIYLGFVLIPVVLLRLFNIRRKSAPVIVPALPAWQMKLTYWMRLYLYVLMLGMPLLGWIYLSADGAAINVWAFPLPAIAPESESLAEFAEEAHVLLGTSGYLFIALHALAALYHHYLVRDNTLVRMLPRFLLRNR